jgi:cation:H+ antiporter
MNGLGTPELVALFAGGAIAIWIAGLVLSKATDALDDRLGLGEAIGGMVLLAIAGSLPELAITVSGSLQGNLDLVAGNLIGGIAMQTLVLAIADATVKGDKPLSYLVGSLLPVFEGLLVVLIVAWALMGGLLPDSVAVGSVSPVSIAIVVSWFAGMVLLNRMRKAEPWEVHAVGSRPGRRHRRVPHETAPKPYADAGTGRIVVFFLLASLVTLVAGVILQDSGNALADRWGMNGVLFGATVLAAAAALPEVSTAVAAVRLGDNQLVMGDIFGGNAFQLCLFLLADLLAGEPVLPFAGTQNGWLAALGILLTTVYAVSIVLRPQRRILRLGPDSLAVIALYAVGVLGLLAVASAS